MVPFAEAVLDGCFNDCGAGLRALKRLEDSWGRTESVGKASWKWGVGPNSDSQCARTAPRGAGGTGGDIAVMTGTGVSMPPDLCRTLSCSAMGGGGGQLKWPVPCAVPFIPHRAGALGGAKSSGVHQIRHAPSASADEGLGPPQG